MVNDMVSIPDNDPSSARLRELIDRQDILDCVYRCCRGIDRLDSALAASAYHPDAIDNHGVFCGPVAEFIEWAFAGHRAAHHGHHHYVMNHTCDLDGDVAHTETYYIFAAQNVRGTPHTLHGGRYVDRFERRDGRWAIAYRTSLLEWVGGLTEPALPSAERVQPGTIARDRTDLSYARPLLFGES
jgi:hypothetical protein